MNKLLYVKSVERCLATSLSGSAFYAYCVILGSSASFETLDVIGIPALEISRIVENNQEITTASLSFNTSLPISSPNGLYSYRLTLMNGTQLLVGTDSRPYTTCEETTTHAASPSSTNVSSYLISYTAQYPPLSII